MNERIVNILRETEGELPRVSGCRPSAADITNYLLARIVVELEDIKNEISQDRNMR